MPSDYADVADMNLDGSPDLVLANDDAEKITWITNMFQAGIFDFERTVGENLGEMDDMIVFDVDGDLDPDIVYTIGTLRWIENLDGQGSSFGAPQSIAVTGGIDWLAAGDVNGDGLEDLAITYYAGNSNS